MGKAVRVIFFAIMFVVFTQPNNAQRRTNISISIGNEFKEASYITKRGNIFVSARELGGVLTNNYFYNNNSAKLEIKFQNYNLKLTARSQYAVLTSRKTKEQQIFQTPVSTILIKDDIFIPLTYYTDLLSFASEAELVFDKDRKSLAATGATIDASDVFVSPPAVNLDPENYSKSLVENKNSDFDIYGLKVEEKSNGTMIRVKSNRKVIRYSSSIRDGILYLFLSGVSVDPDVVNNTKPVGLVRRVKKKEIANNIQLEFSLRDGYAESEAFEDPDGNDILLTIHSRRLTSFDRDLIAEVDKWQLDVVVIDAGHGGKDPGAIGVTGVKEKEINLSIALKLGELIEKNMDSVKVVYTRKTDKFLELYKRGKIANENNGKLFISIHCNSLGRRRRDVSGFEVYLLRPGRTEEAIAIAEFENSVIEYEEDPTKYKALTDENFILVSMAHSSYMRYSEKFSDILNENWKREVDLPSRGIKQAGFYVLVGASMPGVLIESGYLSNRGDEKYLKSRGGQEEIARAIYKAIREYKNFYDRSFEIGG
jgi:N-acetylmuramoyl-L-alanine amidase